MNTTEVFSGTSQYYARFRPEIPKEVVEYVVERYKLDGTGTLLDMGCGTGISTRAFSGYFNKTVAFDVNSEMLQEAISSDNGKNNIEWQLRSDKDVTMEEGPYRLAIACRSFNWMDQYSLLQKLHSILQSGGGVVLIGDGSFWTGKEAWQKRVKEVIQDFLGKQRKAGKTQKYAAPIEPYTITLEKNGYLDIDYKSIIVERSWTIKSIIGYLYSTSFSSRDLYKGKNIEFENTLGKELILANDGKDIFVEHAEFLVQSGIHR